MKQEVIFFFNSFFFHFRNSKKPAGQWHTLIDAAKKGAKKGGKAKGQNKQHKKKR